MDRDLCDVNEVLRRLHVSQSTLYALFRRGDLPCVKIGRRTFVREADLEVYSQGRIAPRSVSVTVRHSTTCSYLVFHNRPCDCSSPGEAVTTLARSAAARTSAAAKSDDEPGQGAGHAPTSQAVPR
jgi:excisionase family DNA binding protein